MRSLAIPSSEGTGSEVQQGGGGELGEVGVHFVVLHPGLILAGGGDASLLLQGVITASDLREVRFYYSNMPFSALDSPVGSR